MPSTPHRTHTVENQPPPLPDHDAFHTDATLHTAITRHAPAFAARIAAYGRLAGGELRQLGDDANRHRPQFKSFDRYGHRIDEAEFHPAYHALMHHAIAHGVHALSWQHAGEPGAHVARAALSYLHHQAEAGTSCPLTMTHAAVPVLRRAPALAAWHDQAIAAHYDGRNVPAAQKSGITLGMGMTEKQGGSDVRANTTQAHAIGGDEYELVGHKWFFSAPMSDAFLVLAQAPAGITCFLLPRWRPDGTRNAMQLMRLKDKLGNWSNASSEVEFDRAWAHRIGDEGRGVPTILEMVSLTRLDCMLGSAAEMRRALVEAIHHTRHRRAFGKMLIEQPLMQNVLADLALESEAATAFSMRVAHALDAAPRDAREAAFARVATAIGKYWICKRAPAFVNEAQECLGGAGYVEESVLPRLYREAPLNSIWEGCGNIQCLDVMRALSRKGECLDAIDAELHAVRGMSPALDRAVASLRDALVPGRVAEANGRRLVEDLALALQAATLFQSDAPDVADAFCASRFDGGRGQAFGTLPSGIDMPALIERAFRA